MNERVESLLQQIGAEVRRIAGPVPQRICLYGEGEDGTASATVFLLRTDGSGLDFRMASDLLLELVYALWEAWRAVPGQQAWCAVTFQVSGTRFQVNPTYRDRFDGSSDEPTRLTAELARIFGPLPVDYSRPRG